MRPARCWAAPERPVAKVWNSVAQTNSGPLDLRWYEPSDTPSDSLILFVHGGGWVSGTLDSYDTLCRSLALRTRWLVASLAYSLSPEIQHPQPIHEVADVIQSACDLAAESGHTIRRLAVCGDSAGGFLIASAMHHLALNNLPLPDAAVFLYPIADVSMQYESYRTFASDYQLTAEKMRWYWAEYLGREISAPDGQADPYLTPLSSPLLHQFPRSMVATVEFDPLLDEGIELARRLSAAGVSAELIEIPGQIHGFLRFRKVLTDPEWGPDAVMERIGRFLNSRG